MKNAKRELKKAFDQLVKISKDHNLKAVDPESEAAQALLDDLLDLESTIQAAQKEAARHITTTLYAIGVETAPGEYAGFHYGPVADRQKMLDAPLFPDIFAIAHENVLVRIEQKGTVVTHVTEAIFLDGEWNDTGDEPQVSKPKEATA